jgi:flagellar hook-basal body protein
MSFYTSLTGLNAATAQLGVTSNNIANVGTTGFKRSRADFGDIFATSPLQKASSTIGQGVALKQVTQEFGQGNVAFSANALDLAITGDGFFPLKSADGLQDIFTRNGSFMMNDQYNVVNSAGQRLMAASVDSSGKADLGNLNVLTIPQQTTGEAAETSLVNLGLNFPADATVITEPFSRSNPATYNKSTALTVYDGGGNGYLATVYYAKTQNATQLSPYNKWQTYVFVGDTQVNPSLIQATDDNAEALYVNKYGDIKPASEVGDLLVNGKTQMFSLDDLTDTQVSQPASISGDVVSAYELTADTKFSFNDLGSAAATVSGLQSMFTINVDGSDSPVTVDLSDMVGNTTVMSGVAIAKELTNRINAGFGDERYFDFSSEEAFTISTSSTVAGDTASVATVNLKTLADPKKVTIEDAVAEMQAQVDAAIATDRIKVSYDPVSRGFKFVDSAAGTVTLKTADSTKVNAVLGLNGTGVTVADTGLYTPVGASSTGHVIPNGDLIRSVADQRFGIKVTFDNVTQSFSFASGTTGDTSSIEISAPSAVAQSLLGITAFSVGTSDTALRGTVSTPAVTTGTQVGINVNNNFSVDTSNNTFVVSVDDVKGTVKLPMSDSYTLDGFMSALEKEINALGGESGSAVSGVKVSYDRVLNAFQFTTGTTGTDSFIKVSGSSTWGLANVEAGRGATSNWIRPTQFTDFSTGVGVAKYIDEFGNETTSADGFTVLPEWSPIYLDKGELTFNTSGNLISPQTGSQLDTVYLEDGKGALTINIDYSASTQYLSAFAVLSQSQDGKPEGDLVGLDIGDDGLVSASYSNGTQLTLAKVILANFSSPAGLRQIGDSSFYATAKSGDAKIGEAGSAGFGTIRAGATERANVDLTQELVDLITAQRNFQANAKAIETSTTMTQAIINIRS